MARPNQDDRQTQGKQPERSDQRNTPGNKPDGAGREDSKGPGREAATGGAQSKDDRARLPNDKKDQDSPRTPDDLEADRGYQKGAREETKNDPNRAW